MKESMHTNDLEQIRVIARHLAQRVRTDPVFKERVRENPEILLAEGLPEVAMPDFLSSTDLLDVSGYLGCSTISSI
jgi:hypothetical protein